MAALFRSKISDYVINENVEVETQDHEDHTFSGVMFTIRAKDDLPVDFIQVNGLSIRGGLGPITVWVTPDTWEDKYEDPSAWTRVYKANHRESYRTLVFLPFSEPVIIPKNCKVGVYVHSAAHGDESIVYDEQRSRDGISVDDAFIQVGAGLAHLSHVPFSGIHPWGAWRHHRQFVGMISYGAKFQLWNPESHHEFPARFKEIVDLFLFMKPHEDCPLSWMPNDCLFYILNMCRHDWCKPSNKLQLILDAEKESKLKAEEEAERERRAEIRRGFIRSVGGGGGGHTLRWLNFPYGYDIDDEDDVDDDVYEQMFGPDSVEEEEDDEDEWTDEEDEEDDDDDEVDVSGTTSVQRVGYTEIEDRSDENENEGATDEGVHAVSRLPAAEIEEEAEDDEYESPAHAYRRLMRSMPRSRP